MPAHDFKQLPKLLLVPILLAALWTTTSRVGAGQRGGADETARTIAGAIDIHVHSDPDDRPRSIDAIDVAKLARARGMRAIVLKNHYDPTAGLAYIVGFEGLRVDSGAGPAAWR